MSNQARRHRIGIPQDPDRREARDTHAQFLDGVERHARQRYQTLTFLDPAYLTGLIAQTHQVAHEAQIGRAIGKLPTATQAQGLVERVFEAKVGLFDITVLVRFAGRVAGGLQVVMVHQRLIALGILALTAALDPHNRRTQIVGSMLLRHTSELPQAGLQPFG